MLLLLASLLLAPAPDSSVVYVDELETDRIEQGWKQAAKGRSILGGPLRLGGKVYTHGIGSHADMVAEFALQGKARRFEALIGLDDTVRGNPGGCSVVARGYADGRLVYTSQVISQGSGGSLCKVPLAGVRFFKLTVKTTGAGTNHGHVDVADARFVMEGAARPSTYLPPPEEPYILTPKPGPRPRLTGPRRASSRPWTPFLHALTATGQGPIVFTADGLPETLKLDAATGHITGTTPAKGSYAVRVTARGAKGQATRKLEIVSGDTLSLLPPLGWNSWNCWGMDVSGQRVVDAAKAMRTTGLADHGWAYINIDDGWQAPRPHRDSALRVNERFGGDLKPLTDQIHTMGLKAGVYSTPWATSYGGKPGGSCDYGDGTVMQQRRGFGLYSCHEADAAAYARWGFDYLKYDWNPLDLPHVKAMGDALAKGPRSIIYSLSNTAVIKDARGWSGTANLWRTTGDIIDTWSSVVYIGATQLEWASLQRPGHFNDPDMLVVGQLGWGEKLHPTRLRPSEQYSHLTMWAMVSAPLLLGCDLTKLDAFTLNLLSNDEVLDIDQDPLCASAMEVWKDGELHAWHKPLEGGGHAYAMFNFSSERQVVRVPLAALGLKPGAALLDCWRQVPAKAGASYLEAELPMHGAALFRTP